MRGPPAEPTTTTMAGKAAAIIAMRNVEQAQQTKGPVKTHARRDQWEYDGDARVQEQGQRFRTQDTTTENRPI